MLPWHELSSILRRRPQSVSNQHSYSLLGLDVGTKTIGLALSDPNLQMAFPLHNISRIPPRMSDESRYALVNSLRNIVEENNVCGLVFGMPLLEDGSPTSLGNEMFNLIECLPSIAIPLAPKSKLSQVPSHEASSSSTQFTTTSSVQRDNHDMMTKDTSDIRSIKWIKNDLGDECVATLWSERHSTVQARQRIKSFSRKRNSVLQHKDTVAATIILQGYLDAFNNL